MVFMRLNNPRVGAGRGVRRRLTSRPSGDSDWSIALGEPTGFG